MRWKQGYKTVLLLCICSFYLLSCSKKGDFINEGKTGGGVHYYPLILNNTLVDTLTGKHLNLTDTIFSPGQMLAFELDYLSKNSVASLELWAGRSPADLKKVLDIPYRSSFFSSFKYVDTVLFHYQFPANLDSLAVSEWYLQPRVVTGAGLETSMNATVRIR